MRIVFMGTPAFAVPTLEQLIASEHEVVAVYTQPDMPAGRGRRLTYSPVKKMALEHGLTVLQPPRLRGSAQIEQLASLRPDVIVVAAFGQILSQRVLDIPPFGCLNIHPSLLPRYRGASPVASAILAGDEYTGATVMLLDAGMDSGPILAQRQIAIEPEDTTGTLTVKLAQVGAELLMDTLPLWLSHRLTPQPQDEAKATYTQPISKEEGEIDWHLPAIDIWRRIRAFQPWPGCYTRWRGKSLKVLEALPLPGAGQPGRVVSLAARGKNEMEGSVVGVQTGEGVLGLLRLQMEGRRAMTAAEFVRGQRDFLGASLPS